MSSKTSRNSIFALVFLSMIPFSTAQATGTTSIFGIISQILGISVADPINLLGVLVTIGVMTVFTYMFFKIMMDRAGLLDKVVGGGHNERNILAIFSVLFTIAGVTGAKSLGINMLQGWQGMIVLFFVFALLAAISIVLTGGIGGVFGSAAAGVGVGTTATSEGYGFGQKLMGKAKKSRKKSKKEKAEYEKEAKELEEEENQIREDMKDGDEGEAVEIEEDILQKVKDLEEKMGSDLDTDIEEVEDALDDLKAAVKYESDEEGPALGHAAARINRAYAYLKNYDEFQGNHTGDWFDTNYLDEINQNISGNSNWVLTLDGSHGRGGLSRREQVHNEVKGFGDSAITYPESLSSLEDLGGIDFSLRQDTVDGLGAPIGVKDYGPVEVAEDLQKAINTLRVALDDVSDEEELEGEAFVDVFDAVENLKAIHDMFDELHNLLQELEADNEKIEQMAQDENWKALFEEVESDEGAAEDLDAYLENLNDRREQTRETLGDAHELMKEFLDIDSGEINRLKSADSKLERIRAAAQSLEGNHINLRDTINNSGHPHSGKFDEDAQKAYINMLISIYERIGGRDGMVADVEELIDRLENEDVEEGRAGQELMQEIESIVNA